MKSLDLSPASIIDTDTDKDISEKQDSVRIQETDDLYHARVDADTVAFKVPWTYKWIALLLVVSLPIGVTWTSAALGPLKNTLRNELNISNTQFGVITASDAIVNSIWPIIGGLFLDWFGPNVIIVLCTAIILIGSILSALATNLDVWRLLVGGHILMGLGTAVLDSAQQKFFYHWFGAGGLAFAFGLENAIAKTISLVSGMTAIPIKESTGWYGYSFWIPAGLCAASFLVGIALATSGTMGADKKKLAFGSLLHLPWAYWMLPMTQLLQSGAAGGFSTSSADIIPQNILPIVLSPLLGAFVDRYGHRFHFVALAPILWIIACSLLGFTSVHPVVSLVFSSLAGVINAMPLQICIPLLVADQTKLGTAFGVWRALNNSGSTIVDIVFGVLQDNTAEGGYHKVLKFAIGTKAVAFALGIVYIVVDYQKLGKGMTMTKLQREKKEESIEDPERDNLTKRSVKPWVTRSGLALLGAMVITAWVVFVKYLI